MTLRSVRTNFAFLPKYIPNKIKAGPHMNGGMNVAMTPSMIAILLPILPSWTIVSPASMGGNSDEVYCFMFSRGWSFEA